VSDPFDHRDHARRRDVEALGAVLAAWRRGGHQQQEEIMSSAADMNETSAMDGGATAEQSPIVEDGRSAGGAVQGSPASRGDYYDERQTYGEPPNYGRPRYDERPGYRGGGWDRHWEDDRGRYERQGGYGRGRDYYEGGDNGDSSFADGASRFARQHLRTGETKEFFKTSEFFVTVIGVAALIISAAVQDNFDAHGMWRLVTALLIAYVLSRGIAKAGSDKREGRTRNGGR
jgi:hypothetical protein